MGKSRKSTIRKFEFYETITDNGIESGYVRLANTQFHSDAVMDLSANSYRVFTYMKFRAKGNKVFTYTYENAIKDASISRQTFLKVKKELIDNGLIKQLASNAYSPSKFEFSAEWKNYHSKRRDWFRIHDLRHSHAAHLIELGFSPVAIAERLGHKGISITYMYAHLYPSKQYELAEKLSEDRTRASEKINLTGDDENV